MTKYIIILLTIIFTKADKNIRPGKFKFFNGFEHFNLTLSDNKTFIQENGGCDWHYFAKGNWSTKSDTIQLTADKLYNVSIDGKKTLADKNSTSAKFYRHYRQLLIINQDTLRQLGYWSKTRPQIKLRRQL